jgi:hypothetical protein
VVGGLWLGPYYLGLQKSKALQAGLPQHVRRLVALLPSLLPCGGGHAVGQQQGNVMHRASSACRSPTADVGRERVAESVLQGADCCAQSLCRARDYGVWQCCRWAASQQQCCAKVRLI